MSAHNNHVEPSQLLTLTCDSAVESITVDHETLPGRLSVRFEHVDRLDGVFLLSSGVCRLDSEHGVDSHRGEKVIVTILYEREK
jgi:hypothetical protein